MPWYKTGVQTAQCHKVFFRNGPEILVCMSTAGGPGVSFFCQAEIVSLLQQGVGNLLRAICGYAQTAR